MDASTTADRTGFWLVNDSPAAPSKTSPGRSPARLAGEFATTDTTRTAARKPCLNLLPALTLRQAGDSQDLRIAMMSPECLNLCHFVTLSLCHFSFPRALTL